MPKRLNKFKSLSLILAVLLLPMSALADYQLNMTPGVTPMSHDIFDLHMTIFYLCCAIAVAVFGVLIYALIKHRKSAGRTAATFHDNLKVEIAWTVIPFIILVIMAIPATIVLIDMEDTAEATVNIKIVGYQWKWKYEYLDEGISYFSVLSTPQAQIQNKEPKNKWYLLEVDKPLVVPIHEKIRFLVTSNDVIHSWWVPALGVKRDAIPGFVHESWAKIDKPGIYRGQCAELCGTYHGFMPIVVKAVTKEDYKKWVLEQTKGSAAAAEAAKKAVTKTWTKAELMKEGKDTYTKHCSVCHKPDGSGMPPAFPALKDGPITTGPVQGHIDIVMHGKSGTAMQAFASQLNDAELAAVITYERNAWGNDDIRKKKGVGGDLVQPSKIAKLRD